MKSFEELEQAWQLAARPALDRGVVREICRRLPGGVHESLQSARVSVEEGLVGDRWRLSDDPERLSQITFMNATAAACVAHAGAPPLAAGDNFLVDLDLSERALPVGAQLRLGSALLEVTAEPHLGCSKFRQRFGAGAVRWVNHKDCRSERLRGVNLRVLRAGSVCVGDSIEVLPQSRRARAGG
jgi:MOSC domain-containing protein YiiM